MFATMYDYNMYTEAVDRCDELAKLVQTIKRDIEKFYGRRNVTAGARARKGLQDLKMRAQEMRQDIQQVKREASKSKQEEM